MLGMLLQPSNCGPTRLVQVRSSRVGPERKQQKGSSQHRLQQVKNKSNPASPLCSPTDLDIPGQTVRGNKLWLHQKKRARIAEGTGREDAVWSYDTFGLAVVIKESLLASWPSPTCVRQTPNRNIAFCEKYRGLHRGELPCTQHCRALPVTLLGNRGKGRGGRAPNEALWDLVLSSCPVWICWIHKQCLFSDFLILLEGFFLILVSCFCLFDLFHNCSVTFSYQNVCMSPGFNPYGVISLQIA